MGQETETNGRPGQKCILRASRHIVQIQQCAIWTAMGDETGKHVLCQKDRSGMSVHAGKGVRHVSMTLKCKNRLLWTCHEMYPRAIRHYAKIISHRSRQILTGILALPLTNLGNLSNNNLSTSHKRWQTTQKHTPPKATSYVPN